MLLIASGDPAAQTELPPLMWTCRTRPDILESAPGPCPVDEMPGMTHPMVPVRLSTIWSCPVHAVVIRGGPGICPVDRVRPLVEVAVAMSWTCPGRPEVDEMEPGSCPDGTARVVKYTRRPHGEHSPRHGGLYFMAPDNWHHIEGTYPVDRRFRVYVFDDYGSPLPPDALRLVTGRAVTREVFDVRTATTRELQAFPLRVGPGGQYLEAGIPTSRLPLRLSARLRFQPGAPEFRFDFLFPDLTREAGTP